jgi:hypothetical protein
MKKNQSKTNKESKINKESKTNNESKTTDKSDKEDVLISITDDKMINEILGGIGKKSNNKKVIIDNFMDKKNKILNNNKKNDSDSENEIENKEKKKTYTEKLTRDEINEKLEDYKLVDDISTVPLGTHLRYFIKKGDDTLFRMGGNLKRNLDLPKFLVLKNALGAEWTVQIKDTTFYKKMTLKEIKEEYDNIINDLHTKIKKLKSKIKELEKINLIK